MRNLSLLTFLVSSPLSAQALTVAEPPSSLWPFLFIGGVILLSVGAFILHKRYPSAFDKAQAEVQTRLMDLLHKQQDSIDAHVQTIAAIAQPAQPPAAATPKEFPVTTARIPDKIGPDIATLMSDTAKYPKGADNNDRIIHYFCDHPELPDGPEGWAMAYTKVVTEHVLENGRDLENAIAQDGRDAGPSSFTGEFPVGDLEPEDGTFLAFMAGRYAAVVRRMEAGHVVYGNIWQDMLKGTNHACNLFIGDAGSTRSADLSTFNVDTYNGKCKTPVFNRLAGIN